MRNEINDNLFWFAVECGQWIELDTQREAGVIGPRYDTRQQTKQMKMKMNL